MNKAIFAGGCFWCMVKPFHRFDGVERVVSGYTGGDVENPSYQEVCTGETGHLEAVEVHFDPQKISYAELLSVFWQSIDPTDAGGQFADRGSQYRPAIFYVDESQRVEAEKSMNELERLKKFDRALQVEIREASIFYPAEEEHQNYYSKKPEHYASYQESSGRAPFLRKVWSEPSSASEGR